jgi:preprotein translocase subunit SecY
MATNLQKSGAFVPGIRPGEATMKYITTIVTRLTLFGAVFLGVIAVIPVIAKAVTGISSIVLGGTSLLILVAVVLDTLQQVESHLLMRHYDGLMKTGRIKGRNAMASADTGTVI